MKFISTFFIFASALTLFTFVYICLSICLSSDSSSALFPSVHPNSSPFSLPVSLSLCLSNPSPIYLCTNMLKNWKPPTESERDASEFQAYLNQEHDYLLLSQALRSLAIDLRLINWRKVASSGRSSGTRVRILKAWVWIWRSFFF